jgi:hypothetical protein
MGMNFLGFLVLFDPPKPNIIEIIGQLKHLGVSLKVITGDNQLVAANVSQQMGLSETKIITGPDLGQLSDSALIQRVLDVDVFAEIEPNQKERIILALRKAGNVVGYLGDGINDASALHAADVGISVDSAVDVAKEAAEIVLLEKDLGVLVQGVREGRTTFANTLKICVHGDKRQFRKHVQHGRSVPLAPVSSVAAQADFAYQFTNGFSGDDDCDRQRGQRNGGLSSALGHQSHSQVYDDLRPGELGV